MGSRLDADGRHADRFVDLQLEFRRYKSHTPIARFGGLYDRLRKDYAGDAQRSRVIELHGAQIAAMELFDRWLVEHLRGERNELDDRVREIVEGQLELDAASASLVGLREMFLTGGRRSGKTLLLEAILNAYAIAVPGSFVWTVTPSEQFFDEPRTVIEELLPRAWYHYRGDPSFRFELVNGSMHHLRSGVKATSLKKGKANMVGLNEGQQIPAESYRNARGAPIDCGGAVLVAANPPVLGDIGTWVLDAAIQIEKGARPGAEHFFCDPLDNPHIDHRALIALKGSMTAHDWETQIRGRMLESPDAVLYAWDRARNERPAPQIGRITRAFVTAHEGDRAEWDQIAVADVQRFPWVAVGIFHAYRDPRAPQDPRAGLLWLTDEVALAQGDEVDVCNELARRGYNGERTLVVMDASCWWQQLERDLIRQRPNYKGKGSADIFRENGFRHTVPPDRASKSNPDIFERIRATNAAIRPADDIASLFIDADRCPNAAESARKWRMHKGKPSRSSRSAHFGDVLGYAVWRFWPRRGSAGKLLSEGWARPYDHRGDGGV